MNCSNKITPQSIAQMIDHSLLQPDLVDDLIKEGCFLAREYNVAAVCVRPYDVDLCRELLDGSKVGVCSVIGFPHGNSTTATKVFEAKRALQDGASELDMVMPVGKILSRGWDYLKNELESIIEIAHASAALVKVIFENHYLTDDEVITCCHLCAEVNADFIKTSTGYAPTGATLKRVALMKSNAAGTTLAVKAAGGIRTLDHFIGFLAAGASRQGTSSTRAIMTEAIHREKVGMLKLQ